MSPTLTDDEIDGLIAYARGKFAAELYPFAPALRPIRDVVAKVNPQPKPEPLPPRNRFVPSLMLARKTSGGADERTKHLSLRRSPPPARPGK